MIFNKFYYDEMKEFIHPNVRKHIVHMSLPKESLIYLPPSPTTVVKLKLEGAGEKPFCTEMERFAFGEAVFIRVG